MPALVFDKYEPIKRLAIGGMGEIFLARQRGVAGFDRLVILKSLLPELAEQPGFIDQFLDEARVAATLNHPNIVSIYEVGAWQGVYFIAMEYINGDSLSGLSTAAERAGAFAGFPIWARIIRDAALGLDHAHFASDPEGRPLKIVHRDVTPQNIMVTMGGVTKVVDFGVARAANRSTRTATGTLKGKIPYMPPEQLRSGKEVDHRTDQWALGVVLWELLTRQRLFKAENDAVVIGAILHDPIPAPVDVDPGIPVELSDIVVRMLQRDREQRYDRLSTVAEELQVYLDSVSREATESQVAAFVQRVAGSRIKKRTVDLTPSKQQNFVINFGGPGNVPAVAPTQAPPPPPEEAPPPKSRLVPILGALGGMVLLGAVVGAVVLRPWEPPPEPVEEPAPPPPVVEPTPPVLVRPPEPPPKPADPEPATVLQLTSEPSEARVYSGERLLGQTPLRLGTLEPDTEYQLVVDKAGFEPSIVKVTLEKGKPRELAVALKKKSAARPRPVAPTPVAPVAGDAFLTLKTTPWTKVIVAGTPYGTTPLFKLKLPPGKHTLQLVNEQAGIQETRVVTLKPGEVTKLDLKLK